VLREALDALERAGRAHLGLGTAVAEQQHLDRELHVGEEP
jgi:hypothetical protein